jgi:hypothetical protein
MKTLILEITEEEQVVIQKALDAYETATTHNATMATVFSAMLGKRGPEGEEEHKKFSKEQFDKADADTRERKKACLRLRLKLLEATERPSEFSR